MPVVDVPLGTYLVAQGTVVIFCVTLVLLVKLSAARQAGGIRHPP